MYNTTEMMQHTVIAIKADIARLFLSPDNIQHLLAWNTRHQLTSLSLFCKYKKNNPPAMRDGLIYLLKL